MSFCTARVTRVVEERPSQGENEAPAETPNAFDIAIEEFLAYLKGYRQPALSRAEWVLAVDDRGVWL
jgi:hypothetical protein